MAEPRKVQFVTLSAFAAGAASESRKRRLEDEADCNLSEDDEIVTAAAEGLTETGAGGAASRLAKAVERDKAGAEKRVTVRLNLPLSEPDDRASAEFNYGELLHNLQPKNKAPSVTLAPNPNDPFDDDEKERRQVEALAKKFESKYGNVTKKKKDRMQDLIDIGFGYDETDPFIDNSEAYDELVPASLTTKLGGFYINTGTLQFRAASDSEGEDDKNTNDDSEQAKMRKMKELTNLEEKKSNEPKQGVTAVSLHRPEKKKRKKLMKDSLYLAAMLRRFSMEKEQMRKNNLSVAPAGLAGGVANKPRAADAAKHLLASDSAQPSLDTNAAGNSDLLLADLSADPAVMSLLGSANEKELQDLLGDLDFGLLDGEQQVSSTVRENGILGVGTPGQKGGTGGGTQGRGPGSSSGMFSPPPLPAGLPPPLVKRIEDLRAASRQFDQEGRKKFFTLDMNNILLDIELQVQKQPPDVRSGVYAHLEAFVPCNKEALLKRLKKLSLKIQVRADHCDNGSTPTPTPHSKDDKMRMPLLELKLAVCNVMPEQIARYNMDCMAKVAKQQSEEGERNGSEEEDEEKPGKRVMGPRKKFVWDDKLRSLLCTLVQVKLSCYDMESQCSLSVEDYLKAFLENEVKPLWPKGWMQARILFKESVSVHVHLTGTMAKRRVVPGPKAKAKEGVWIRKPPLPMPHALCAPASSASSVISTRPPPLPSPSELICLSDSLDEDLSAPSLDSISHALALLTNASKGLGSADSPLSPPPPRIPTSSPPPVAPHYPSQVTCAAPAKLVSTATASSTSSRVNCRPADSTYSLVKATVAPSQRQVTTTSGNNRPSAIMVGKTHPHPAPSPPKQRPPPTASPLMPPHHQKGLAGATVGSLGLPQSVLKGGPKLGGVSNNGGMAPSSSLQSRAVSAPHPTVPSFCPTSSPTPVCQTAPSSQVKARPQQPQSNFITPMQATLTKPSHSTNSSPIIKLTPRPPPPTPPPSSSSSSSPSPSSSPSHPSGPKHQYSPKTFRPPFGITGSVQGTSAKQTSGAFTGGPKPPTHNSAGNKSSSSAGHANKTPPPPPSANHAQRQRLVGSAGQNLKAGNGWATSGALATPSTTSHLSQVSAAGGPLLGSPSTLPLGFGMLGGLVPVSLPFQFPPLLNFSPPGAPGPAGMSSAPGSNSGYPLAQSDLLELYKSLQSGSQAALPPHLQLAFSDTNQSQGGDKRKPSH
ncbi:ubinuclein-2a isoform X1 [Syngnathus scovelli]|uniref:ubinuclein-2a isoform X1 n=1 Tax=Syngnathus scovelli TaxID=161590 RepID=UPI00210FD461|nr:ubinuclein-2a isoform X1 [Syngnathus scovelli]